MKSAIEKESNMPTQNANLPEHQSAYIKEMMKEG